MERIIMKRICAIITLFCTATLTFNAAAAELISRQQAQDMKLQLLGTITTTDTTAPMDAKADLSKKADEKGGRYFVIIAEDERGRTVASAEVYK